MLTSGLAMVIAGSVLASAHFGPNDNVKVELYGEKVRVTAFGDAPVVPLLVSHAELAACVRKLEGREDTACEFKARGSLTMKISVAGYTLTFADPVQANIVDFTLDEAAYAHAIRALSNPS